jgi:AraC-like DNA-binding protein
MHDHQVSATIVQMLLGFAETVGLERSTMLDATGLTSDQIASEEALVPFETPIRIWELMLAQRPGEPLGLMLAETARPDVFGLPGHLFRHSQNVEQILEHARRYRRIFDPKLELEPCVDRATFRLEFHHDARVTKLMHPLECMVGSVLHTLREWLSEEIRFEVWFAHPPQFDREIYDQYLGVPVHFEMAANAILAPSDILAKRIVRSDPLVAEFLKCLAEERLEEQRDDSLAARVAEVIAARLDDHLLVQENVASDLGMSVRTLQRHLRDTGHTYSAIHDEVRREAATRLIRQGKLAIYQIAERLGYAEPANFTRAFRRWTGQPPGEFAES